MPKPTAAASATHHRHVAVFAFPFATHAGLLLGFTRRLAAALPDVTFSFFSTAKSNQALFSGGGTPENVTPHDVSDGVPEGYKFSGQPMEDIDLFMKVAPEVFRLGAATAAEVTGKKVTCVLADAFLWFAGEMAEEIGVAWVPLWTSGAFSLSTHFYTDLIRQTVGSSDITGREDEILTFIPGFPSLRLGDLPSGVLFGNLNSPFSIMLHKMGQLLPKATVVPINSFKELDPEINKDLSTKFKLFLNVGPFNLTSRPPRVADSGDHSCLRWLDGQNPRSVAYIGFGTVAAPPPHELVALAEALEECGTPFIWSLRDNLKVHLPNGFLERTSESGMIVPWAPQVQILEHASTGVVITHCGWNSVLECIAAGVPMIGRPFFGDHQINTWMVEKIWKIGIRVEGGVFTKKGLICALEEILLKEKGKKLKENISVYKELALKAVGPNGSSTQGFKRLLEVITSDNF